MNNTNRAANRTTLFLIGLLFLIVGAAVVLAMVWPVATDLWTQAGQASQTWLDDQVDATVLGDSTANGVGIIAVAVLVVAAIILILCITRLIGRRSRAVLRSSGKENPLGRVTVTEAFASDALQRAFDTRDDILFASVSANDIRKQPVLHVSVSPRQNTSPRVVLDDVHRLVTNLATLTGQAPETFISLHSGLRTRLAHDQRRLS